MESVEPLGLFGWITQFGTLRNAQTSWTVARTICCWMAGCQRGTVSIPRPSIGISIWKGRDRWHHCIKIVILSEDSGCSDAEFPETTPRCCLSRVHICMGMYVQAGHFRLRMRAFIRIPIWTSQNEPRKNPDLSSIVRLHYDGNRERRIDKAIILASSSIKSNGTTILQPKNA